VVGSEVSVVGLGVGEQVPDDGEGRVAHRDDRAFLPAPSGQAPTARTEEGVGARDRGDDLAQGGGQPGVARPVAPRCLVPADRWSMGANVAQEARWAAVGKRPTSTPTSATSSWAATTPTPVIASSWATWWANGATTWSTWAVTWSSWAVTAPMRSSISWHRKPWWSSKRPVGASSKTASLDRRLARASWARAWGLRWPAMQRLEPLASRPPEAVADHAGELGLGVLEELLQPLGFPGPLTDQAAPVAGQVAPAAARRGMHQARPAPPALDDLGRPPRVQPVGLGSAGDVLDVLGPQPPAGEPFGFQPGEGRLPVAAGGLHRHQRNALAARPVGQFQQRRHQRGVLADRLPAPSRLVLVRNPKAAPSPSPCRCRAHRPAPPAPPAPRSAPHRSLVSADHDMAAQGASGDGQAPGAGARGTMQGPSRRLPASASLTASASAKVSRRRRAAGPIFSPARASPQGHRGLNGTHTTGGRASGGGSGHSAMW
jgi:hypothetical protein